MSFSVTSGELNTQPLAGAPTIHCLVQSPEHWCSALALPGLPMPCVILAHTAHFGTERSPAAAAPPVTPVLVPAPSTEPGPSAQPHAKHTGRHPALAARNPSSLLKHKSDRASSALDTIL